MAPSKSNWLPFKNEAVYSLSFLPKNCDIYELKIQVISHNTMRVLNISLQTFQGTSKYRFTSIILKGEHDVKYCGDIRSKNLASRSNSAICSLT